MALAVTRFMALEVATASLVPLELSRSCESKATTEGLACLHLGHRSLLLE